MPGTECGPLHDLYRPYQSIWHIQSLGTLENYSKVCLSCQIHSNGAAVPWCTSFNTVQHDVFCHAYRCLLGWRQWYTYYVSLWLGTLQPRRVASQIQGADRGARGVPLSWWHGKGCSNRGKMQNITKTRLFKYIENFTTKNWKFSDKNSDIFYISAQNIDCGYSLEPPRRGGSNEYP